MIEEVAIMETYKVELNKNNPALAKKDLLQYHNDSYKVGPNGDIYQNDHKIPLQKSELGRNIKFSYIVDQDTGKIRIKVYDFMTGETIQEIPSDKFLEFLKELKKGIDEETLKKNEFIPTGLFIENKI
jgi:uncharacterized FlaG/YvyC family protein